MSSRLAGAKAVVVSAESLIIEAGNSTKATIHHDQSY
jgi:hypothetical protein